MNRLIRRTIGWLVLVGVFFAAPIWIFVTMEGLARAVAGFFITIYILTIVAIVLVWAFKEEES